MTRKGTSIYGVDFKFPRKLGIATCLSAVCLFAQPRTSVIKVNPDGSFTPQVTYIRSGDTVRWEQLTRADSVIPVDGARGYPAMCTLRKAFDPAASNEFTGPMPFAPSGVYTLSPLERGNIEATGRCPPGTTQLLAGDNGKVFCTGGNYAATMDSTWSSPDITGVFVRLLWSDLNPRPGVFDFTILQREMEQAVKNGKLFSLGIKAGSDGTPDWIFATNPDNSPRSGAGGGVPRLHLQDTDDGQATACGVRMDLGNPTNLTYRKYYSAMLTELSKFVKTRADWYRSLAYVRIGGANLFSHENRLPKGCEAGCTCNPAVLAADGYRPSALYSFYDEQTKLLHDLFPGKAMGYMLIQDGFPRVNEGGGYQTSNGNSSNSSPLPGFFEQTQVNLDRGQQAWGLSFVVAHNGLQTKGSGCPFEGVHPKPIRPLDDYVGPAGSKCPNRWAVREGAEGQITGFQVTSPTNEDRGVQSAADLDLAFLNEWDNSDGVYFETYENVFWLAENTSRGVLPLSAKRVGGWADDFHRRRNDPIFKQHVAAGDPFPSTYSFTFKNPGVTPQNLFYVHGVKCGGGKQEWGSIVIDAQPPAIRTNGVVSASSFGQFSSVAPGSWMEIYGSNLAVDSREWTTADFSGINAPMALAATTVRIGGQPAFVQYVSPGQVNAQVPSNVGTGSQPITISTDVGTSAPYAITVNPTQPGLLAPPSFNVGGRQYAVAFFPDNSTYVLPPGSIAGLPSRRAKPGDIIILYGVGFGPVTPSISAGQLVQQSNALASSLKIFFGQTQAVNVPYAGLAPGAVGLYQFNVVVPNVPASDAVQLSFTLNGTSGTQLLYLPVQN